MKVIALTGPKRVGKTTVANAISDNVDRVVQIMSFADPMRLMLQAIGVRSDLMLDQNMKETPIAGLGKSARQLLQTLGTEWGREMVAEDIWLWAMDKRVQQAKYDGAKIIIIDDCRFDNEAKWIEQQGGSVILLERAGYEYGADNHSSEQPINKKNIDMVCDATDEYKAAERIIEFAT
mgnify:CR=1 FL=1